MGIVEAGGPLPDGYDVGNSNTMDGPENDRDGGNDDDDVGERDAGTPPVTGGGLLSKSWSIASAHVPTFTGGRVTHSFDAATTTSSSSSDDGKSGGAAAKADAERPRIIQKPFLLLPVNGDLAIVDANRGVKWGTVRAGASGSDPAAAGGGGGDDDDDDEDEGVDQEAITAYALDHRNQSVITCTRNNLLRQYALNPAPSEGDFNIDDDDEGNDDGGPLSSSREHRDEGRCAAKLLHSLGRSGHTLPVTSMAFHASDVFLATGSVDGTVRIWDVRGRYVTHVFRPLAGGDGGGSGRLSVTALQWRPKMEELVIAIGRDDGSVVIHDLRQDRNDKKSAGAGSGGKNTHGVVAVIRDHVSAVTCMDWWGDEFFVSTGRDAVLNLWRIVLVEEESNHENDKKKRKKKQNSANGSQQLGQEASPVQVLYRRIQTIPVYEQIEGMVVFPPSSDSKGSSILRIVTAGSKGSLRKWKAEIVAGQTPELVQTLEQPDSQTFGEARGGYMGLVLNHTAVAKHSKDQVLIAVDAEHNLSFVNSKLTLNRTIVGHNDEILDLKIIPNSTSVVVATNSPQVRVFDMENFSCSVLDGHTATVLCVDASPCGRYLASCGKDKTMRLWKTDGHRCVAIATGHTEPIGACGLSQKVGRYEVGGKAARNGGGAFCVTASVDRTLKRWNLFGPEEWNNDTEGENEPVELLASTSVRGHEKDINIVSIAPNDSIVATGSQDKMVKLWNATDLTLKATLKGHRRGVWDCQFSPIDRVVATSSGDKTIKLWSLADYSCVRTFQGHVSSVLRVRFLSTGLQLVSSGADGLIKVWTIRTNECETTLDGHSNKVWALDLAYKGVSGNNANKDLLVSGGADSKILVWEDTTAQLEEEERAHQAETILLDQKMANHLRHKEYHKALEIALKLDKPMQVYKVLTALLENEARTQPKNKEQQEKAVLQKHVATWDLDRVAQVLKYCRDWNTRARNAPLAMWVLQAIVTTIPVDRLTSKEGTHTPHGSIPELLAGITPYAERHFDRLDRLHASSFLLDYLLFNISSMDPMVVDEDDDEFAQWEAGSKLVLPPKYIDGRIQVGGKALVGRSGIHDLDDDSDADDDKDEVLTVGDSSSSDDSDDNDGRDDKHDSDVDDGQSENDSAPEDDEQEEEAIQPAENDDSDSDATSSNSDDDDSD